VTPDVAQASSPAWFGDRPPPRRGEHQAGVHHSYTRRESNLAAVRRYPVRPGRRLLRALPTAGDGVRKPSGRRRSQLARDRRHLVGPWDRRHSVGSSGYRV